ncbi:MAG: hypothetical protein C4331_05870 [Meiothermus sp.]
MTAGLVELLELYEYKVDDLARGAEPKGGLAGLNRLRQSLIASNLSGPLGKRFREIDSRFKAHRPGYGSVAEEPPPDIAILIEDEGPAPVSPEREVLDKLTEALYWSRLEKDLGRAAKQFNQGKRDELRMVYAILQNLEAYSATPQFAGDYNLSRFSLSHAIPGLSDPRVALENTEVGQAMLTELFRQTYTLSDKLNLPPEETVPYLRRFARRILDSEGALRTSIKGPNVDTLRRALEEARRQQLGVGQIRELEERLQAAAAEERRMALVHEEDKNRFAAAIERISVLLSRYLPAPRGETPWPQIPQKIFGAQNPDYALSEISPDTRVLTLRLQPQRLRLEGHEIAISQTGQLYGLSVEGQERSLDEHPWFTLTLRDAELQVLRHKDYLHLRLEPREAATLSNLLAEGRVLAYLMWPERDYAYLRLMRALSMRFKGETNYAQFGPESASKYGEATVDNLQDFARKGLETVRGRIERTQNWPALLSETAEAMGLEAYGQNLRRELSEWLGFQPPSRDTLAGNIGSTTVGDSPSSVKAGGTVLSLRFQESEVYVSSTGLIPRKLHDMMVWPVPEGGLVLAREAHRVAHTLVHIPQHQTASGK